MKKYLSGIIAVIIATCAFAFTQPEKKAANLSSTTFYYEPASDFSSPAVQNKTNWRSNMTPPSCAGAQNKACQFDVDNSYTHLNGSVRELNTLTSQGSVLSIATVQGANNGSDYVPSSSTTGISNIANKP